MKLSYLIIITVAFLISCDANNDDIQELEIIHPVKMQLDAYNKRDANEFAIWFAEDIELIDLQSGDVFCTGREQLKQIYRDMFAKSPDLNCNIIKRIVCGNIIIDEEKVTGIRGSESVHATAIYEIEDGLIKRAWFVKGD